uniref:Cytoplasmic linker protein-related n=1 Tax=uncultured crenarchaeote MCG TaxID=529375 RepID=B2YI71_9CREN|nr:cytoplasmic linker protein-related [uncultured crenarchaeote MCG]
MLRTKLAGVLPSLFLLINSISWFSLTFFVVLDLAGPFDKKVEILSSSYFGVMFAYFAALIASAVIGATLFNSSMKKRKSLIAWISIGGLVCMVASALNPIVGSINAILVSLSLGAMSGLGIPACLASFSENSKSKSRGRYGAVAFFAIQVLTAIFYFLMSWVSLPSKFLVLGAWRLIGGLGLFSSVPVVAVENKRNSSLLNIIRDRTFFLYFLPWFLFCIVNFVEEPIIEVYFSSEWYQIVTLLISSCTAFVGGVLCDFRGRKFSGILGFILLGLGYAFLSFPIFDPFLSKILYLAFEGVAWGILYVTFIFVIWGDIAETKNREKYYLLGCMPFLLSNLISGMARYLEVLPSSTFSLAALFLFLAVIPLLYAPETLSDKILKARELKNYIEKARKQVAKAQEKEREESRSEYEEIGPRFELNSDEFVETEEVAEKTY